MGLVPDRADRNRWDASTISTGATFNCFVSPISGSTVRGVAPVKQSSLENGPVWPGAKLAPLKPRWLKNEIRHQFWNAATLVKPRVQNPEFTTSDGDRLLGRYARTGVQWEAWLQEHMETYSDMGAAAIDIGANVGFHTKFLASQFESVYAFEPCQDTAQILTHNMQGIDNLVIHQLALGESTKEARMMVSDRNRGTSHISAQGNERVQVVRLDSFDFDVPVALIKMDVEGHEAEVLRGGEALITRDRPVVFFEDSTGEAQRVIMRMDYRVQRIAIEDYIAIPLQLY